MLLDVIAPTTCLASGSTQIILRHFFSQKKKYTNGHFKFKFNWQGNIVLCVPWLFETIW